MPIHEQGYRRYGGRRGPHRRTWWVIARAGLQERLRERRFLALLLVAWSPFLVRAVQIYVSSNFTQVAFLGPTADTFREFLDQQSLFVFFMTIYAGAGLVADDRRAHALQIYLSKPLTRVEYVAGKLVTLLACLAAVTWLPAMLLLLLQVMFAGSTNFVLANPFLVPAITVFCGIQVLVSSLVMLAMSSLSTSRRFAGIMYAGFVFFTGAMYQVLNRITGTSVWAWMSPEDTFDTLAHVIFRVPGRAPLPLAIAMLVVTVLIGSSLWILNRRIRAVEVVA